MNALTWLALALAGGAGAIARFEMDAWVARLRTRRAAHRPGVAERRLAGVPLGTLTVNMTACLLLGLFTGALTGGAAGSPSTLWLTILGTGFCGGFSTFSTACVESARLVLARKAGAGLALALTMTLACQATCLLGFAAATLLR